MTGLNPEYADSALESLVAQARNITERWAKKHDHWYDAGHKDPLKHYDSEPEGGEPILIFWSEGSAMRAIEHDDESAQELRNELDEIGLYMAMDDNVTAGYYLIDHESNLQKAFDRLARWKWICRLIEADTEEVSGDLYKWFAENPSDFHRLPHREFEKLVSSIFAARGWKTEIRPGSGDGGIDLRIWQTDPLGDLLTLVQVKRYAKQNPIKLEAVAALEAHVEREKANRGLFVTSSRFLPGVREFATRNRHRIALAGPADLQQWCEESAHEARAARNRASAMEYFIPLIEEIRQAGSHPRLLVSSKHGPSFCVILKETSTSALLIHIPSEVISGDALRGQKIPVLNGTFMSEIPGGAVFRAVRKNSDHGLYYWGRRHLYTVWDGKPCWYDHWD